MTAFTPWSALAGGLLIGLAAVLLLALNGRIAGVSSIASGALSPPAGEPAGRTWRLAFLLGLMLGAGACVWSGLVPAPVPRETLPAALLVAGGVLVGFGTGIAKGCTSGHGVCGLARLSPRSLVATLTFLGAAMLTTFIARHVIGGGA
jgi:uncharacterized membrane protein YedE/YeeE